MFKYKWTCTTSAGLKIMVVCDELLTDDQVRSSAENHGFNKPTIVKIERNR